MKYRKHVVAGHGQKGGASRKKGADGDDVILEVPLGTIAIDPDTRETLFEIEKNDQKVILLEGGKGGLGNWHFRSPTNQSPRYAQPGLPGKEEWKILELKLLGDVGLVGFPNAGKSTLLSTISAAKPKIGDYPFTTLVPNLGIVPYRDYRSFVMADIPGIIEKAHAGKGLGLRFLRHIERNAVLLFIVPADSDDIHKEYLILLNELNTYNPELAHKPRILGISKSDLLDEELKSLILTELPQDIPTVFFSSLRHDGLETLKDTLWNTIVE